MIPPVPTSLEEALAHIRALEHELEAKQRTIEVLMDTVERGNASALGRAVSGFPPHEPSPAGLNEHRTRRLRQALAEVRAQHRSLEDHSAKLEEAATFQRSIVDAVDANICILDGNGVIVATNAQWRRFARDNGGGREATGLGVSYLGVCRAASGDGTADAQQAASFIEAIIAGDTVARTMEYACHGAEQRWYQLRVSPLHDSPLGRVVIAHIDITDRHAVEARLSQAERLESIGQLAAGIAHEINTPMQYIGDNLLFLDKAFQRLAEALEHPPDPTRAPDGPAAGRLDFIRQRVPRAIVQARDGVAAVAKIVAAMRQFTRQTDEEIGPANVNAILENALIVSRNSWKYVAEMTTDLAPDLPEIMAEIGGLSQVFLNLLVNAGHAIEDTVSDGQLGSITVATRHDVARNEVRVEVRDSGTGIRPEILDRVFDPFFTTKAVGRGTGQGLAITRSIVDRHHGQITVSSRVGQGSTFTVILPVDLRLVGAKR